MKSIFWQGLAFSLPLLSFFLLQIGAQSVPVEDKTLNFVVVCGKGDTDSVDEMLPLLKSAILLSTTPLKFILMTDNSSAEKARAVLSAGLPTAQKRVSFEIWTISKEYIRESARAIEMDTDNNIPGLWATAKIFVPWILKDQKYEHVIVLDSDMVFLQDPTLVWTHFNTPASDEWLYQLILEDMTNASTICSSVVMMNIPRIVQSELNPYIFRELILKRSELRFKESWMTKDDESELYKPLHADQGIYYWLKLDYPNLVLSLPQRFNIDHCFNYHGSLKRDKESNVSILHLNCEPLNFSLDKEGQEVFDFYKHYKWSWLRGYSKMNLPVDIATFSSPPLPSLMNIR